MSEGIRALEAGLKHAISVIHRYKAPSWVVKVKDTLENEPDLAGKHCVVHYVLIDGKKGYRYILPSGAGAYFTEDNQPEHTVRFSTKTVAAAVESWKEENRPPPRPPAAAPDNADEVWDSVREHTSGISYADHRLTLMEALTRLIIRLEMRLSIPLRPSDALSLYANDQLSALVQLMPDFKPPSGDESRNHVSNFRGYLAVGRQHLSIFAVNSDDILSGNSGQLMLEGGPYVFLWINNSIDEIGALVELEEVDKLPCRCYM